MALEFFVEMRKIRRRLATFVEAPRSRSEQRLFQLPIIPAFGQRPSHPCRLGVFQILVNRSVSDRAATGDLPLPQSQLVSESQYFFELSHGQPFRGQCWFPPLTSGTLMPALLSSVLRPAPSRTVQGLWKSFRNDPGQGSGHRRKVTGLRSESVTGFIPEWCPESFRNRARPAPESATTRSPKATPRFRTESKRSAMVIRCSQFHGHIIAVLNSCRERNDAYAVPFCSNAFMIHLLRALVRLRTADQASI